MENITLSDIREFITEMEKNNLVSTKNFVKWIPFMGHYLYRRALFLQTKIDVFKKQLEKAEKGTAIEQQKFIDEFAPIIIEEKLKDEKKGKKR